MTEKLIPRIQESARITWPLTLTLTLSTPWMQAYLVTIMCKFGRDRVICLREEKRFAQKFTDRRTDDGRRAIALPVAQSFLE